MSLQVDEKAIREMTDAELQVYLPVTEDRVAVRSFLRFNICKEKAALQERLKEQMKLKISRNPPLASKNSRALKNTMNAMKADRAISFHWSNFENGRYQSIGKRDYGGFRDHRVAKDLTKSDLITIAKGFYFDGDISTKGPPEDFHFDLALDARGKKIVPDNETIDQIIERTHIKNPRFYLLTRRYENKSDSDEELPEGLPSKKQNVACDEENTLPDIGVDNTSVDDDVLISGITSPANKVNIENESEISASTQEYPMQPSQGTGSRQLIEHQEDDLGLIMSNFEYMEQPTTEQPMHVNQPQEQLLQGTDNLNQGDAGNSTVMDGFMVVNHPAADLPVDVSQQSELPQITDNMRQAAGDPTNSTTMKHCTVRRGFMFEDLLAFAVQSTLNIATDHLTVCIKDEKGEDSGGVLRDCLVEFWQSFYNRFTVGNQGKVPVTVHTLQEREWQGIAHIIILGFKQERYFPIQLSKIWMKKCMFPEVTVDEGDIIESFLTEFLPDIEREILQTAATNFESVDNDELLEILHQYDGRVLPNSTNIWKVINEVAHHEMIQKPSFVYECWSPILSQHIELKTAIHSLYDELMPTAKKVLKILILPEANSVAEQKTIDALKRYIKNSTQDKLHEFLRYCTGSDLLVRNAITVRVTGLMSDIERRPIAHTCGCVLELSSSYADFVTLRSDFDSILNSKALFMDIV